MPEIQMPKLSDTMTEGTLVSWKKKVGDQVAAGEVLAEIETDKATMEWESTEDGTLQKIYIEEGEKVNVGERIAFIGGAGEESAQKAETEKPAPAQAKDADTAPPQQDSPETKSAPEKSESEPEEKSEGTRVKASPLARKIAAQKGIDLTNLKGSGPGGRIVEKDLEAAETKAKAPVAAISAGESARINLTGMRKVIAERLSSSLGPIPHFY